RDCIGIRDELALPCLCFAGRWFVLRCTWEVLCHIVAHVPFVVGARNNQAKARLATKARWLDATLVEVLGNVEGVAEFRGQYRVTWKIDAFVAFFELIATNDALPA